MSGKKTRFPDVTMFGKVVSGDTNSVFGAVGCFWKTQLWLYEGSIVERVDGSCVWEWKLTCAGMLVADMVNVPSLEVAVEELNKAARAHTNEGLWFMGFEAESYVSSEPAIVPL